MQAWAEQLHVTRLQPRHEWPSTCICGQLRAECSCSWAGDWRNHRKDAIVDARVHQLLPRATG